MAEAPTRMATRIGVDEVGRGPLAGPVVACACIARPTGADWEARITDSKALTAARRKALAPQIQAHWLWALGEASVAEIDALNIRNATFLAMRRALAALVPHVAGAVEILVDGNALIPDAEGLFAAPVRQQAIVGGDASVAEIGAASIVAKVYRDALMTDLARAYPAYGWEKNAGYGTAVHMAALTTHGVTPHHRTSFAPVREALPPAQPVAEKNRHAA